MRISFNLCCALKKEGLYFQFILLPVIQRFGVCLQINCLVTYAATSIFNSDLFFYIGINGYGLGTHDFSLSPRIHHNCF